MRMPALQCGIYAIVCSASKRSYVGSSKDISRRWVTHRWQLRQGVHCNAHLQNAWNKYGEENFSFKIIERVAEPSQLHLREQSWLNACSHKFNILLLAYPLVSDDALCRLRAKRNGGAFDYDELNPCKTLERHLDIGPLDAARHLGIAYSTYAAYRSGSRKLPRYHLYHIELLLIGDAMTLEEYVRYALGNSTVDRGRKQQDEGEL